MPDLRAAARLSLALLLLALAACGPANLRTPGPDEYHRTQAAAPGAAPVIAASRPWTRPGAML